MYGFVSPRETVSAWLALTSLRRRQLRQAEPRGARPELEGSACERCEFILEEVWYKGVAG